MPRNFDKTDYSGGLPEGMSAFAVIEDPRTGNHNHTRSGHAARNLGSLRRTMLYLVKLDSSHKDSVPKIRLCALLDTNDRQQILSLA